MNRILILGASGFIGHTLYKELHSYFDVYGTYCHATKSLEQNQILHKFDVERDDILEVLEKTRPAVIISALNGNFTAQYKVHRIIVNYILSNIDCKVLFLSSYHVFDGKYKFPSYESDTLLAESNDGKHKISIEKLIKELPKKSYAILRIPLVLGVNSPMMNLLKQAIKNKADFEVYPNLIISVSTANKIAQQMHYIINKKMTGIFHLASEDVVHHEDLFKELASKLSGHEPIFKRVFSRNEDSYLAILAKEYQFPKAYRITVANVIEESILHKEINLVITKIKK